MSKRKKKFDSPNGGDIQFANKKNLNSPFKDSDYSFFVTGIISSERSYFTPARKH